MAPTSKLVLVEMVVPTDNTPGPAQMMDLNMMVMLGGRERTEAEYGALLARAGLKLARTIRTMSPFAVLESTPA